MKSPELSPETIFAAALELVDPEERRAYLHRTCDGNSSLRAEVESLLAAHAQASGFLEEQPTVVAGAQESTRETVPLAERSGDRIGRYRLLQQIGEGGFGVVWMAEQLKPVHRRVALKIIKLGMDTREVIARFESERQALALMDHSNIARVFDGGATESGRPYFVMELVRGEPITRYCDVHRLSLEERLELFLQVCQAVQHAHQKGVIHRDLKPSNILVAMHDNQAVPKVIDFGIAKATQQRLTEKTLFTRFNQFIGTPAYMSPEQAGLSSLDVDTRSDIYSLGVLLYELLTGRTPFSKEEMLAGSYDEICRIIREKEPPKPSTRLSTMSAAERSTIAAQRKVPPEKLGRLMRGELDWVAMKGLEKDRNRRYATANALAQDLEHYLNDEPVSAAAPTLGYLAAKFLRRNRLWLGTVGLVIVLLVAGIASTAAQMLRANRYAAQARRSVAELAENLYAAEIYLAQRAILEGNYGLAHRRLASLRPRPGAKDLRGFEWTCLWRLCQGDSLASWPAHSNAVRSLSVSPDGRLLGSASYEDHEGKLWEIATRRCVKRFANTDTLLFSPEGDWIFGAGHRDEVEVWNARTLEREFAFSTGAPLASERPTVRLAVSPIGPLLAVCPDGSFFGGSGSIHLYDYRKRHPIARLPDSGDRAVFSRDGRTLVTGSARGKIHVWDAASGEKLRSLGPVGGISSLALSPNGRLLATTEFWLNFIRLWDLETGTELPPLRGHEVMIWQVAFSPDGQLLASVSSDQTIRLWHVQSRRPLNRLNGHTSEVWSLAFAPDGNRFYTGSKDESIAVWPTAVPTNTNSFPVVSTALSPPLFSPTGRWIAAAGGAGDTITEVVVRGMTNLEVRTVLPGAYAALRFSDDDNNLLTLSTNAELHFWNLPSATVQRRISLQRSLGRVIRAVASKDGRRVAALSQDQPGIWLVAVDSGRIETELNSGLSGDSWVAISPDNQFLAACRGRAIEVWNLSAKKLALRQQAHKDDIRSVFFSPDGRLLVSTSVDNTVKIWGVPGWRELAVLSGHREGVVGGDFSPDGRTLATCCADGTVKLWHLPTYREIAHFKPLSLTWHVSFSPDGRALACAPGSGPLFLLRSPSLKEIDSLEPKASSGEPPILH